MENKALFRRTTHKESSQGSVLNPKRGSYINILDSSCESQFQFFTHSNIKPERSTIDVFDNQCSSRAKTPILENYNSQVTDGECKLSPQGILKKPQTAKIGMRKQVHYNNIEIRQNSSNCNNAIRSPKIENILESSYFRSSQNTPPRTNLRRNTQDGAKLHCKVISGIMPGNCKDHITIK